MTVVVDCPDCQGVGYSVGYVCPGFRRVEMTCILCAGGGLVGDDVAAIRLKMHAEGEAIRKARIGRRETMRDAAKRLGLPVPQYSRIEFGLEPMP